MPVKDFAKIRQFYDEHKWQLQLSVWAFAMLFVVLMLARQCQRDTATFTCSQAMTDSLQQISLPDCQRIEYTGHIVYYDSVAHLPRCVVYELTAEETQGNEQRAKDFMRDDRAAGCPDPTAYSGSGMTRGHIAPAADFKWAEQAMKETFMMTNICPQDKSLNEGGWNRLEEKVREWARRDGALIVAAGPVITPDLPRMTSGVAIPRLFFKVILSHKCQPMRAIAFLYPNAPCGGSLKQYMVSVDSVEHIAGFDLFSALPDDIEQRIESQLDLNAFIR